MANILQADMNGYVSIFSKSHDKDVVFDMPTKEESIHDLMNTLKPWILFTCTTRMNVVRKFSDISLSASRKTLKTGCFRELIERTHMKKKYWTAQVWQHKTDCDVLFVDQSSYKVEQQVVWNLENKML